MPWPTADEAVFDLIRREVHRQNTTVQLIASENFASPAVMAATGSVFTNKYSEGYPGRRYYGGNMVVDEVEDLARRRACGLFGADHANVQPHAGAIANMGAYQALIEAGDTVLGMSLDHGGHLTHGSPVNFSGLQYRFVSYGVTASDERIDMDQLRDLALAERPKLIVAGATAYPRLIQPEPLREIADESGALLMFDAAHIAGLIAGGVHPNPTEYADVVTFTTHKTLRGPRGGAIICRSDHAKAVDKAMFPGIQGGPLDHAVAAKAVAFAEAATDEFADYAARIVENSRALATLDRAGISLNKNTVPDDPRSPFVTSGVRIGTPAVTTQGMDTGDMATIADLISRALRNRSDDAAVAAVRADAEELCAANPPYPGLDIED